MSREGGGLGIRGSEVDKGLQDIPIPCAIANVAMRNGHKIREAIQTTTGS